MKSIREIMNKKRLIAITIMLFAMSGIAIGAWLISINTSMTGQVVSTDGGTVAFSTEFSDFGVIDVTSSAQTVTETAVVTNNNGNLSMVFNTIETIEDVTDGCSDYLNDTTISYELDGVAVVDGETIMLGSGDTDLSTQIDFALASCPQNVTVSVSLAQV